MNTHSNSGIKIHMLNKQNKQYSSYIPEKKMQLDKDENVFRPETLNSSPLHSDRISISMYKAVLFECKGTIQSLRFKNISILIAFFFPRM